MQRATLIKRWAAARGLEVDHGPAGSRVTMHIDGKYRVHLGEAPNRKLSLESRIRGLPADRLERERLVERAMQVAVARMRTDGAILTVDALDARLLLQAEVPADADERDLDEALERFVNSLAAWRQVV
jgi:hypothetical protein